MFVIVVGASIASCAPVLHDYQTRTTHAVRQESSAVCGINGNSDFYGLGIRIGIYLQWTTAFLSNHLLQESIGSNLETNTIFLLALFVAMIVATINKTVQTAELIVLLHLCFGFLFSILSIWGHRTRRFTNDKTIRFPLIGSFFRLSLATGLSAYALWFWFRGRELHHLNPACDDYTFLFTRFDAAGNVRIFLKIQTIIVLVVYAILYCRELITMICFFTFLSFQTAIIAGVTVWFGARATIASHETRLHHMLAKRKTGSLGTPPESKKESGFASNFVLLFKQWARLSLAMGWKQANGKESAGENRPHLNLYLVPFIDVVIFILRTLIQFLCLLIFKRAPPVDFIPMLQHPWLPRLGRGRWSMLREIVKLLLKTIYEYV